MNYQWYPGHMTKAIRAMKEQIGLIDLVLELVDARVPESSRNPDIDALSRGKLRILVLNKADLADPVENRRWKRFYEERGLAVLECDARASGIAGKLRPMIAEVCREKLERDRKRGIVGRPVRAMAAGIPNVGKSTFINSLAGRASAKTGNKPGVTRGNQWIRTNAGLELLDTPGILWPKFEDEAVGRNLAFIGSMNDEILEPVQLASDLIRMLRERYPVAVAGRYGIAGEGEPSAVLGEIATARGCLRAGQEPDLEKASGILLEDFRSGRLGRITPEGAGADPGGSGAQRESCGIPHKALGMED